MFGISALAFLEGNGKARFVTANVIFGTFGFLSPSLSRYSCSSLSSGRIRQSGSRPALDFCPDFFDSRELFFKISESCSACFGNHEDGGYQYSGLASPLFVLYLLFPVLPFFVALIALRGSWKIHWELGVWSIGCLALVPFEAGYRFAFLAVIGIIPIIAIQLLNSRNRSFFKTFLVLILFLGTSYAAFPPQSPFPYYNLDQQYSYLMPSSLMTNSLPISENQEVTQLLSSNIQSFNCHSKLATTLQFYNFALSVGVPSCSLIDLGSGGTVSQTLSTLVTFGTKLTAAPDRWDFIGSSPAFFCAQFLARIYSAICEWCDRHFCAFAVLSAAVCDS